MEPSEHWSDQWEVESEEGRVRKGDGEGEGRLSDCKEEWQREMGRERLKRARLAPQQQTTAVLTDMVL